MTTTDAKEWVERWKRVGPLLEQIESEELRDERYADGLTTLLPLLDWCCARATPRSTSGLVEQQRLFRLARKKEEGMRKTES